ncbi:MAG TPA: hypothetical protein PLP19_01710 [bacterium]|nr:hypothetical protein [bacterium]HPN42182.1 hypothetical protein [bacterium]
MSSQNSKPTAWLKKALLYAIPGGALAMAILYAIACLFIFTSVKTICTKAEREFKQDHVTSLMAVVISDKFTDKDKNDAIWALGQIGAKQALPLLESMYTGIKDKRCNRHETICQYELEKAIRFINSKFIITRWMYRNL